jgi:uncharacterized membrane protein
LHHGPEPAERRPRSLHPLVRAGFIEYDRVIFFSDAVFAIAITLLAINLRVFHSGGVVGSAHDLHEALPSIFAFGISFLVIGFFWIAHHGIFRYIVAVDRRLIAMNLAFLGVIAFLPYPTNLLSASVLTAAVVFYAGCCALAGLLQAAIWWYASRPSADLADPEAQQVRTLFLARILRVPAVFLLSIPIAFPAPRQAPFVWLLIAVSGRLITRFWPQRKEPEKVP